MDVIKYVYFGVGYLCLYTMYRLLEKRMKMRFRRWWTKPEVAEEMRERYGAYATIFLYIKLHDEEEFYNFVGMRLVPFVNLLNLVQEILVKRSRRRSLPPELRLAAVLK